LFEVVGAGAGVGTGAGVGEGARGELRGSMEALNCSHIFFMSAVLNMLFQGTELNMVLHWFDKSWLPCIIDWKAWGLNMLPNMAKGLTLGLMPVGLAGVGAGVGVKVELVVLGTLPFLSNKDKRRTAFALAAREIASRNSTGEAIVTISPSSSSYLKWGSWTVNICFAIWTNSWYSGARSKEILLVSSWNLILTTKFDMDKATSIQGVKLDYIK
jgi:hypothetical protein